MKFAWLMFPLIVQMIGCDNETCKYQWVRGSSRCITGESILNLNCPVQFHLACVGLSKPLPESWFCKDCDKKEHASSNAGGGRRGRKRQ